MVKKEGTKWVMKSTANTNKKVAKWALIGFTSGGGVAKKSKASAELSTLNYQMSQKSMIFDRVANNVVPLEKFVETPNPKVTSLYGSEELAVPGVLPKGAVKMVGEMQFECADRAMAQAIRELSAANKCLVLWAMRHDPIKQQVVPVGLAVVTSGQVLLPAGGKVLLE